ncbi:bifunctional [glutamate--ammonia ligase]-adenylyl-L-tyrosine phosphorylase/[glutamate--ammonia-ligase] adenylyltransferase [Thiopseudomonas alkaliphila]|uniref:bifunctional [glutamate--ammonia ligase]-adenylyl-L-tyrosine phosphorylase/[glutamate--ammonia-ligase] adenylyltransferase n=1 Tax=Thiopseudomonas alkaliphila TaxID=1697053 RepID=UPI002576AF9F|nr:bifunctional [glutamate--ammonia ligase]-adenylyl-L-tyrosine phosphorylase/[glutamate--ammonia-ligase] adenylyltransferase [Thiopseudomonas alkaliphila]MDM1707439.1 bifunctional [glutamate--ammonia ligase]-adenylyl-L-tyrosine phosphorylase/[glutamate--ammonia-ligase] adenylyltransferase [Thiopseudomonas alkaliphila]
MIPAFIKPLPEALLPLQQRAKQRWLNALAEHQLPAVPWSDERQALFLHLATLSDFILEYAVRCPNKTIALAASGELDRTLVPGETRYQLNQCLAHCETEEQLILQLRLFRNRQQFRIIWRDLSRQAELGETCRDVSALADACIDAAYQWLYQQHCALFGTPIGRCSQQPQHLVVLGMGKLGAYELNLSSDVDLIFAYPEAGETQGAKRSLDNQEFFTRLGQKLIKALDVITAQGFAFRVDMRLRPYGSGGPLVYSFTAMEQYYQNQGRDWERYAMIKARVVGGAHSNGAALLRILRPFVYRRYLDFSAIEALRSMKQLIQQEVRRKDMDDNIKLGSGGIREVEFIAQAFQLIHGGRDLSLQQRPLLNTLDTLSAQGYLTATDVTELKESYRFLRYTEHALQAVADRQTQTLPDTPIEQQRIATIMGFANWTEFLQRLAYERKDVEKHFREVIADPDCEEDEEIIGGEWLPVWEQTIDDESASQQFIQAGYSDGVTAVQRLHLLRNGSQVRAMQRIGRERLDAFMPRLLSQAAEHDTPDLVLERVLPLIEAVARRSAYLVLLTENPGALLRLITLCAASPWIAEQITRFPALLDELLNEGRLYRPPLAPELAAELRERLMRVPEEDVEQQLNVLRHFKLAHRLRVAASEIAGTLPLMKVSDYLTWLAEAILEQVMLLVWQELVRKHGYPKQLDGCPCELNFIILGYGKLGGIELGHSSDLDLVFIYDCDPQAETDGPRPVDGAQFYTRLGQRIISMLTTRTTSGGLYDVDMRLRPSGDAGLLASTLTAFERYQLQEAWTWEHQALVRARVVAGCPQLAERFNQVRQTVLAKQRDLIELRSAVSEMRWKMRDNLATQITDGGRNANAFEANMPFDLKQDAGGIVDIEFIVQYAALAWSWQYPELVTYTDNIRILDALNASQLFTQDDVLLLQEAYKSYRAAAHRFALQKQRAVVGGESFHPERQAVLRIWQALGLE